MILTLDCKGPDCTALIHGTEDICFSNLRSVNFPGGGAAHGHLQANYAEGLIQDLHAAAHAAGWHHDGIDWLCARCTRDRIVKGFTPVEEMVARALAV